MNIVCSYDKEFEDLFESMKREYPRELFELEGIGSQLDLNNASKKFFLNKKAVADVSVDSNANVDDSSIVTYNVELPRPFFRLNSLYLIWKYLKKNYGEKYANSAIRKQIVGDYYINDLHGINQPYCYNFSTYDILVSGLPFVKKIKSNPPKHLSSFVGQLIHFAVYASNSVLGAVGLADCLIVMSYYVEKLFKENQAVPKDYIWKQVKQEMQSLIFSFNQPFRGGIQSGFYNVSIYDRYFLSELAEHYVFPDGSKVNIDLVIKLQEMFLDLMNETLEYTPATFPVITSCLTVDVNGKIRDTEMFRMMVEKNLKFGFQNFYFGETSTLSSCCRLRSEYKNEYFNQLGAGGTKIGSLGVVTLNLPRMACIAKGDKEKFFTLLKENVDYAIKINNTKRNILEKRIKEGSLPLYTYGFMSLKTQYSTVGLLGLAETCENMGMDILSEEGQAFVDDILDIVNEMNSEATKLYNAPHNAEQVPAENSAIKLAQKDTVIGYQYKYNFYSNQFIPLISNANLLDRIELQGRFDKKMSGGAICHLNIEQRVDDVEKLMQLLSTASQKGVVYTAINYNLQKCKQEHMTVGKNNLCPICNSEITDNFTRVVGFLVNTKNFHKVRREIDYPNRKFYKSI